MCGRRPVARSICAASLLIAAPADRGRSSRAAAHGQRVACEHAPQVGRPHWHRAAACELRAASGGSRRRRDRAAASAATSTAVIRVPPASTSCPQHTALGATGLRGSASSTLQPSVDTRLMLVDQRGADGEASRAHGCAQAANAAASSAAVRRLGWRCPRRKASGQAEILRQHAACSAMLYPPPWELCTHAHRQCRPRHAPHPPDLAPGQGATGAPAIHWARGRRSNAARWWSALPPTAASAT